jgi:hypothetical protein
MMEDVAINGGYAYVACEDAGIKVIDIADPSAPSFVAEYDTPGYATGIIADDDYVYVKDGSSWMILRFTPTGIGESDKLPSEFSISQNYPNPFNAQTTIQYSLPTQSTVSIDIFDILGCKIKALAEEMMSAGIHRATWDAGSQASGIYFYRIKAGDKVETKKMTLLR